MDEREWWACVNPEDMLAVLMPQASERKVRLFVAACARDLVTHRPDAAAGDGGGSLETFQEAIDRVEAYVDGAGALVPYGIWLERDVSAAAYAVVGVDVDVGLQLRDPLEAISDFRVNPAHWLRDIFGPLPFRPVALSPEWRTPTVLALAQAAQDNRTLPTGTLEPDRLVVLADALEEADCHEAELPGHLRNKGDHVRGCWAVDAILGKS